MPTPLRDPFVHFVVVGCAIFGLYAWVGGDDEPQPASGGAMQPDRRIVIGAAAIEGARDGFRRSWRREPAPEELGDLLETYVHEEVLFREGQALALDRDDVVVRRRVIEKMSSVARPATPVSEPSEEQLKRWYDRYQHRFAEVARFTVEQRFFDPKKRASATADASRVLGALAAAAREQSAAEIAADDFVLPKLIDGKSELQVAHLYGEGFVAALRTAPVGRWAGPFASQFGQHLVFVVDRQAAHMPSFEQARKHVRADWLTINTRGLKAAAETLLPRYQVALDPTIDAAVAQSVARARSMAPLLGAK